ncbi:diaminobutyrate acetyltransferase [Marinimicrobium sp. ABcell2]|uniref:diaminobutyrate acetyltransferase n=1 Tax=Marinimicrobium sp. ABcell2 TaxID=3069751 RepID=UPI0027B737CC|nr:diaminobutyrate acetyltransferase [Marinimicrobium sp. ABcell2]MDQ2077863.1 diaminobutyrate acetyltransferase [Marinimicrobium sp. ABcell2]
MENTAPDDGLIFRKPSAEDGYPLNQLVAASPPLDPNSIYCNLLQCSHFADTAVAVVDGDELVGFVSGYLLPNKPDTLFVWQVVISERARGKGLAKRMLKHLLARPECQDVRYLETTITPDNEASWALFRSLARDLDTELKSQVHFEKQAHFGGVHDDEHLLILGSFNPTSLTPTES